MSATNGASHIQPLSSADMPACPACGSRISRQQLDKILRLDEARRQKLDDERALLEQQREAVEKERATIATKAAEAERKRWESERCRVEREIEKLRKKAATDLERMERDTQKKLEAEAKRRESAEKQVAKAIAVAEAKAKADGEARLREAKRSVNEAHKAVVDDLQSQLKTLDQRRRRDEDALKQTITDLQRRAESRDRAHFGPESEEQLVDVLRALFSGDKIDHRGKGGDVFHHVFDRGREIGLIIFECKNRTSWEKEYLRQIRRDMEANSTHHGILVSRVLPAGQIGMCVFGDVIVAAPALAAQVAQVVREGMIRIARLHLSEDGKSTKKDELFEYLRSDHFRTAILRVREKLAELQSEFVREKSAHEGFWRRRDELQSAILRAAAGIDDRIDEILGPRDEAPRAKALRESTTDPELEGLLRASVGGAGRAR